MSTLERAIAIAAEAHAGQTDKAGSPYILHPLRVMLAVQSPEERIVAVLHDVVEDGGITPDYLMRQGFSEIVLAALASVTKTPADVGDYEGFVRRAGANAIGRVVKLADLRDNSDLSRIRNPSAADFERTEKYRRAIEVLEAVR
jgi:hypothetical protein